jgi:hypothetical protein
MKSIVKKLTILSMVGIMQVGFGASVIEASPLYSNPSPILQQYDRHDWEQDRHERERIENERHEHERRERVRIENERHEREMQRRPFESRKHWRERQRDEVERHERAIHNILNDRW